MPVILDNFDKQLISTCDVVSKRTYGAGSDDSYGQPIQQFVNELTTWPCRVSTMGSGHEYKVGKEFAKNDFKVFMRPPTENDSGLPFELTTHHWLRVTLPSTKVVFLNVTSVNDPSLLGHHLEVIGEQVIP